MNEPWPGNMYENPAVMAPGLSEFFHLQEAFTFIANEIRKIDPDHNICYEPVTWLNTFPAGFLHPPGGKRFANTSIFCYHYYNPPSINLKQFMKARMRDVKRLGGAGILSEFMMSGNLTGNLTGASIMAVMD
jgi:endoglycosylceramidase